MEVTAAAGADEGAVGGLEFLWHEMLTQASRSTRAAAQKKYVRRLNGMAALRLRMPAGCDPRDRETSYRGLKTGCRTLNPLRTAGRCTLSWTLKLVNGFVMDRYTFLAMGRRRI